MPSNGRRSLKQCTNHEALWCPAEKEGRLQLNWREIFTLGRFYFLRRPNKTDYTVGSVCKRFTASPEQVYRPE
ncbi:hypothetical protein AOLI_G00184350 [Acnodon oligacanthus]